MNRAIELAKESASHDEVPVGVVIVKDDKIIAESGNRKERDNCAVCHAEIVAIKKATEALGNWWLEDCDLYVTLEPCPMCAGAIVNARIKRVIFGAYDQKAGAFGTLLDFNSYPLNHKPEIVGGVLGEENVEILRAYFKKKR